MSRVRYNDRTIVFIDNKVSEIEGVLREFVTKGYQPFVATTNSDALLAASRGAGIFVFDVRLFERNRHDNTGLHAIKDLRDQLPNAVIAVYSVLAERYEVIAKALGADIVLPKTERPREDAAFLEIAILNKRAGQPPPPTTPDPKEILRFVFGEAVLPVAIGLAGSAFWWHNRLTVGTAVLPLLIAASIALFTADYKGMRHAGIRSTRPFRIFHRLKRWFVGAVAAGIVYDICKGYWSR